VKAANSIRFLKIGECLIQIFRTIIFHPNTNSQLMLVHKLGYHRCLTGLSCLNALTHTSLCAADDIPAYALVNLNSNKIIGPT
jgi:hypothetical protein